MTSTGSLSSRARTLLERVRNEIARGFRWLIADVPDMAYTEDLVAARYYGAGRAPKLLLVGMILFLFLGFIWTSIATVEEVTRGEGRVIPSTKTQIVQSLEGGIVKEILVRTGAVVEKGDLLLRIDDTGFASTLGELKARRSSLQAQIARLEAEAAGSDRIDFGDNLNQTAAAAVASELALFNIRRRDLDGQKAVLLERKVQREQELAQLQGRVERLKGSLGLAKQELALNAPLVTKGIVPRADYLRLQREVNDIQSELDSNVNQLVAAEAAVRESLKLLEDADLTFQREAQAELTTRQSELAVIEESLRAAQDRVARTDIRSPVKGIVNAMRVATLGGVVQPGADLIEITPLDDALLVEARIRPADIAFISPGQRAMVKLTAYDFTIYGGLEGVVEQIGADAIVDAQSRESYYTITVRTTQPAAGGGLSGLPIIPGMVASVDIITGEKSILAYLMKPITRARHEALRER
ncbi:MAG: HlyD family type I secretion periplasmic adaptor subunit [Alphaproteobacteria bacterium]|nr:HlyD family type I secretion periplasmic adaptor subunit [Alphaproteobacteria bacterium]